MNLKKIEKSRFKKGVSTVRVSKNGAIAFSAEFCRAAGLDVSLSAGFYQDGDRLMDWYVNFSKEQDNNLRAETGNKSLVCNNSIVATSILNSANQLPEKSIVFKMSVHPIEENGMKLYAIITKAPKI